MKATAKTKLYLILFFLGCLLGTVAEYTFNITGLTYYPELGPFYRFGDWYPIWAPVLFGAATVAIVDQSHNLRRFINDPLQRISMAGAALSAVFFMITWATISTVPLKTGGLKDVYVWLLGAAYWLLITKKSKHSLVQGAITAFAGTLFESTLGYFGAYIYRAEDANLFGLVPTWLFALYFLAGITIGTFSSLLPQQRH
jgi:hypothetical protein